MKQVFRLYALFITAFSISLYGDVSSGTQFGKEATNYSKGRRGYGEAIYTFLAEMIPCEAKILDVGCGTGIATRELYAHGFYNVQGCDIDPGMLAEAENYNQQLEIPITYTLANVVDLPEAFSNEQFDVITAFNCFHWFSTSEAIKAICDRLQANGMFIVVLASRANFAEPILKEFWDIIEQVSGKPVFDPRMNYQSEKILIKHGFLVENHSWEHEEQYTFEEVMSRLQSFSGWCALTEEQKQAGLPLLEEFVKRHADYLLQRTLTVKCLIAKLPSL